MTEVDSRGRFLHVVTLDCKDTERARQCIDALREHGRPDAMEFGCLAYEFGRDGARVLLVERWADWGRLDALLEQRVVPALPLYNELLAQPFDPARDTRRVELA